MISHRSLGATEVGLPQGIVERMDGISNLCMHLCFRFRKGHPSSDYSRDSGGLEAEPSQNPDRISVFRKGAIDLTGADKLKKKIPRGDTAVTMKFYSSRLEKDAALESTTTSHLSHTETQTTGLGWEMLPAAGDQTVTMVAHRNTAVSILIVNTAREIL